MAQWLLNRLFETKDQPTPRFAFQGTVNWMRALSIIVENGTFASDRIKNHYRLVQRRQPNAHADTLVFENMLMAFHNHASLVRIREDVAHPYDVCRSAIINWYYSTYFTCSAMIAAASGAQQETHTHTARVWQSDIVNPKLVLPPFSLNLTSLVETEVNEQIAAYRCDNPHDLNTPPKNEDEAWGAIVSYLKGTWSYEKWRVEERLKGSREFKALGVADFRKKAARELRDAQLAKNCVNFLIQAFRYRGKANYRDSIFLSYGYDCTDKIETFIQDMEKVSIAHQHMAAHFLERRVQRGAWSDFIADLKENSRLSLAVDYLDV